MKKIYLAAAVLVLVIIVTGVYKKVSPESLLNQFFSNDIGVEAAKTKVVDFVENNMVQPGTKVDVSSVTKDGDLYKIALKIGAEEIETFITQDGQNFFPNAINIDQEKQKAEKAKIAAEEAEKSIPKNAKPVVDLYVMSFCPYGNQAEDTMKPVYDLLKNKVDFNFRYIVSSSGNEIQSLHGQKEVDQNEREACVLKNYGKDAWMNFASYVNKSCGSDGSCWEAGAKANSLDTLKISSCVSSEGTALMQADEKLANEAGASGSPTLLVNGSKTNVVYKYGNSEAYKQTICNAFDESPSECTQELSSAASPAASAAAGGSCE